MSIGWCVERLVRENLRADGKGKGDRMPAHERAGGVGACGAEGGVPYLGGMAR